MRVLVTGIKGQLGYDVVNELNKRKHTAIGVDIDEMDITDSKSVESLITALNPDAIIHCAAWTAVDAAEDNIDECRLINAYGTENIAKLCKQLNCKMVYISTDYVFDGQGIRPWEPDDPVENPLNVYGQTKYEGEQFVQHYIDKYFIVRIAWAFGINGKNFVNTMLNLTKTIKHINVVNDQIGTPTYTYDLARLLVDMIETEKYGIYHVTNEGGYISWYDFAVEIFKLSRITDVTVTPVSSENYTVKAKRPRNSRLCKDKLEQNGFKRLPVWQDALQRFIRSLQ